MHILSAMDIDPLASLEAEAASRGVSFADVLSEAGVATTTFWRWKGGRFDPRASTVRRLKEALDRKTPATPAKRRKA